MLYDLITFFIPLSILCVATQVYQNIFKYRMIFVVTYSFFIIDIILYRCGYTYLDYYLLPHYYILGITSLFCVLGLIGFGLYFFIDAIKYKNIDEEFDDGEFLFITISVLLFLLSYLGFKMFEILYLLN